MQGLTNTFDIYSAVFMELDCVTVHKGLSLDPSINTPKNTLLHSIRIGVFYSPCFTDWKSLSFCYRQGKET